MPVSSRVVDLKLWSQPRQFKRPRDGKTVAHECRTATGLSDDVVLGLNFIPDAIDIQNLDAELSAGEVNMNEFRQFCLQEHLSPDPQDKASAACFRAFRFGQPLAWLHFPAGPEGLPMAKQVLAWAQRGGYAITRGQSETSLAEGEIVSLWSH